MRDFGAETSVPKLSPEPAFTAFRGKYFLKTLSLSRSFFVYDSIATVNHLVLRKVQVDRKKEASLQALK